MRVSAIANVLGGPAMLRVAVSSSSELMELTRRGLPSSTLGALANDLGVQRARIAKVLRISERTLSRRIAAESRLTAEESDRAVRLARVLANAQETLGTRDKASRWLQTPNRALDGEIPLELLDTDTGVQSVEALLGRINYGIFS